MPVGGCAAAAFGSAMKDIARASKCVNRKFIGISLPARPDDDARVDVEQVVRYIGRLAEIQPSDRGLILEYVRIIVGLQYSDKRLPIRQAEPLPVLCLQVRKHNHIG